MFPNWTGWKTVKAVLFVLIALDGWLMTASEFGPETLKWAKVAAGFLGTVGTVVVGLSGTDAGPTVVKAAARAGVVLLLAIGFGATTSACGLFRSVSPAADFGACVDSDVLHGDSVSAIVSDCGGDVPAVIAQIVGLLGSKDAARYSDTKAAREVRATRLTLDATPIPAEGP